MKFKFGMVRPVVICTTSLLCVASNPALAMPAPATLGASEAVNDLCIEALKTAQESEQNAVKATVPKGKPVGAAAMPKKQKKGFWSRLFGGDSDENTVPPPPKASTKSSSSPTGARPIRRNSMDSWGGIGGYYDDYSDFDAKYGTYKLTPEEIARREQERIEREKREESARLQRLEEERKQIAATKQWVETVDRNDPIFQAFQERVLYKKIKSAASSLNPYVLLIGNAQSQIDPIVETELRKIVKTIVENEKLMIYDADSSYAALIRELGGERALGITAYANSKIPGIISITNPYMRTEVFASGEDVIHTPDSLAGLGALMLGNHRTGDRYKFKTLDLHQQWVQGLVDFGTSFRKESLFSSFSAEKPKYEDSLWGSKPTDLSKKYNDEKDKNSPKVELEKDSRPRNLGIEYGLTSATTVLKSGSQFSVSKGFFGFGGSQKAWNIDIEKILSEGISYNIAADYQWTLGHLHILKSLNEATADEAFVPGGTVVFGSSGETDFDEGIFSMAQAFSSKGSSVRHGGAGGVMRVAAEGAKAGSGKSIGIPMGASRHNILKKERVIARDVQDLTLEADGYEARISGLLHDVGVVMIAPGGSGTMREVAATLVQVASQSHSPSLVLLVSKNYYQKLYDFWQKLPLPESVKANIKLVDSPEEAIEAANEWKTSRQ